MKKSDPKPEIDRLEQIVLQVKSGNIKLPRFQRPFVWKASDILKLFDSIYNGYPIGSLLIWHSSQKLISEREILGIGLDDHHDLNYPTNYLLDGQQRLTSLCGALFWNGDKSSSPWNIGFNLETESFHQMESAPEGAYFPLNKLMSTTDFLKQCNIYAGMPNGETLVEKAEQLLSAVKDYKIAVVKLGDMTVEEVAPIFERINSTGRKLTMVDLMMAATWSSDFDLTNAIKEIQNECVERGFSEVPERIILRSLSASADLGINKDDIQKLRALKSQELSDHARKTKQAIIRTVEFYSKEIQAHEFSYIPYALQFTHACEFFRISPDARGDRIEELKSWIWFTNATRYFGSSNSGQNRADLQNMRNFATGTTDSLYERREIDISRLLFDTFNLRNATSTSFALLLISLNGSETVDGRQLSPGFRYVKNSRFFASLLPETHENFKKNISMAPHPFLNEPKIDTQAITPGTFFVDETSKAQLEKGEFDEFILHRARKVAEEISIRTKCKAVFSENVKISGYEIFFENEDDD